jgi:hypothetical protein
MRAFHHLLCTVTFRKLLHGSDFGERGSAEKLQVNRLRTSRLDSRQFAQHGIADRGELIRVGGILDILGIERSQIVGANNSAKSFRQKISISTGDEHFVNFLSQVRHLFFI